MFIPLRQPPPAPAQSSLIRDEFWTSQGIHTTVYSYKEASNHHGVEVPRYRCLFFHQLVLFFLSLFVLFSSSNVFVLCEWDFLVDWDSFSAPRTSYRVIASRLESSGESRGVESSWTIDTILHDRIESEYHACVSQSVGHTQRHLTACLWGVGWVSREGSRVPMWKEKKQTGQARPGQARMNMSEEMGWRYTLCVDFVSIHTRVESVY